MVLSLEERKDFIKFYHLSGDSIAAANVLFSNKYGQALTRSEARNCVEQWNSKGTVNPDFLKQRKGIAGRPITATTAQTIQRVQVSVTLDPQASLRRRSLELDIPRTNLQRILKKHLDLRPYRIRVCQQLYPDDPQQRLWFCDKILEKLNDDPMFLHKLCFSDEARFHTNGVVTPSNWR